MSKQSVSIESMQQMVSDVIAESVQGRDDIKLDGKSGLRIPLVSEARRQQGLAYSEASINIDVSIDAYDRENNCLHGKIRVDVSHVADASLADMAVAADNMKYAMDVVRCLQKVVDDYCAKF